MAAFAALATSQSQLSASLVTYFSRSSWSADVDGPIVVDDLDSFLVDTEFRTGAVDLNGMTIQEINGPARNDTTNKIDVAFLNPSDVNDTPYAEIDVGFFNGTVVRIDFDSPVSAFGFDEFSLSADTVIDVYDANDVLIGSTAPQTSGSFYGFILDGGETAGRVEFRYAGPVHLNDVFGADNLSFVTAAVPEPSSLAMLGGALVIIVSGTCRRMRFNASRT